MSFVDILCGVCGELTTASAAATFDSSLCTVVTGFCSCVFHVHCVRFLPTDDRGHVKCHICCATASQTIALTKGICYSCPATTSSLYCPPCWVATIAYLYQQLLLGEDLTTASRQYMQLRLSLHDHCYRAWFLYQLTYQTPNRPFLLFYDHGSTNYLTNETALLKILALTLTYQPRFSLKTWIFCVTQILKAFLPTLLPLINPATFILSDGDKYGVALIDGNVTKFIRKIERSPIFTYVLGQTLVQLGAQAEYEYQCEQNTLLRLFLPTKNDFLYYPKPPAFGRPPEPNFKNNWLANM